MPYCFEIGYSSLSLFKKVLQRIKYNRVRKVQPNFAEYTGTHTSEPIEVQLFVYDSEGYEEYLNPSLEKIKFELTDPEEKHDIKWLNIHGLHDVKLIQSIGDILELNPYVVGDVLNVNRRARLDEFDDVLFFSIKSVLLGDDNKLYVDQISFLLKDNTLVSFQERRSAFFSHLRERIRSGAGIIRKKKNDYLLYVMLDAVIENFFITIEHYEDRIELLMVEAKNNHKAEFLEQIERLREETSFLKRNIIPLRDALYTLKEIREDDDFERISKSNYVFFARLYQKCLEIVEQLEYDNKTLESAANVFFSSQSQKMNQIMKTLTIFSVIFMPLTFIVGIYGMNFEYMPELKSVYGYPAVWLVMLFSVVAMVIYFKKKKWF